MILTIDLGTTATKATVWSPEGPVGMGRSLVASTYPRPGWVEQDPAQWWDAVVAACAGAAAGNLGAWREVTAVAFSSARETFVPVRSDMSGIGAALVWSDRRAVAEAGELAEAFGGAEAFRQRTGAVLDAGLPIAKARWLVRHEPDRLATAAWLLGPRDLVLWRLTGVVATDWTLASRTGFFERGGTLVEAAPASLLPPVTDATDVSGVLASPAAQVLGLRAGIPVVVGAGDRACEVLAVIASPDRPMVSWGTTANVSVPEPSGVATLPRGCARSMGALGGALWECGLSAAGSAIGWLASISGHSSSVLWSLAAGCPPGAGGVLVLPWFGGARAPWWEPEAQAMFAGLGPGHGPGELARAIVEGVAFDVARSLELLGVVPEAVALAGAGGTQRLWAEVLSAVVGVRAEVRAPELAASAGACLVAARALGEELDLSRMNPVTSEVAPDPLLAERYPEVQARHDALTVAALGRDRPLV